MVPEMNEMNKNELFRKNCPIEPNEVGIASYWSQECPCKVWSRNSQQNGHNHCPKCLHRKLSQESAENGDTWDSDLGALIAHDFNENGCNNLGISIQIWYANF